MGHLAATLVFISEFAVNEDPNGYFRPYIEAETI